MEGLDSEDKTESIVGQFFQHYGHPLRNDFRFFGDRFREIFSMLLVAVFVLYFPAGLLSLLWMSPNVQYIWLGYQVYIIIAMHFLRLLGGASAGRAEKRAANILQAGGVVYLKGMEGPGVKATLATKEMGSMRLAEEYIEQRLELRRNAAAANLAKEGEPASTASIAPSADSALTTITTPKK